MLLRPFAWTAVMYGIYGMNASRESAIFMGFGLGLGTPKTASLFFDRKAQLWYDLLLFDG
jgi:hypothetical protein